MVHSLKTPKLKALAEALGWEPRELEERIFELGIAVLSTEANRLAEAPCTDSNVSWLRQPEIRLIHWTVAAANLLTWEEST